jgi:hypothetical protein
MCQKAHHVYFQKWCIEQGRYNVVGRVENTVVKHRILRGAFLFHEQEGGDGGQGDNSVKKKIELQGWNVRYRLM